MKRTTATFVALISALTLAACSDDASTGAGSGEPAFNDADVMFAQMMVPHHEQAIEVSDVVLAKSGVDPQIAALAEQIKAAQGPEIEQLNVWLEEWDAGEAGMEGMDHGMEGMLSEADMQHLADSDGAAVGDAFLEHMIAHHEGAVAMAETEVADGANADAVAMAESVIETQTAEIETMRGLLAE
ncbi:DUF305 domain-containing protein [Promicromonospora soli]|uniref:DUF305 domain-containing protein n=1 Tax=Promicromonospora soli TaxID=2035533 RepID=A0A919G7A9_9MICO|nr:DUF305 domain-containing protein [Promicromonospora soli]GHH79442.1 DUF305 domain-containing protein [Promicromonospora soli]